MFKRALLPIIAVILLSCISQSCSYRLDAASTVGLKTINVQFFENNAPFVVNNLSQNFTEALKTRIRSQTSLSVVRGEATATMSGAIVGYSIAPVSVQATSSSTSAPPIASQSRLTITVNVKYTNEVDKKLSFEQSFSRYADYKGDISNQEQTLIAAILPQITEDVFNKAFANW